MTQRDRALEAKYIAPSGVEIPFLFEELSTGKPLRGKVHQFPSLDGQYVQRTGVGGRSFPLRMIFGGEDCDIAADAMWEALSEEGVGTLQHPTEGLVDVAPLGDLKRTDNLTREGEIGIDVTLYETLREIYPSVLSVDSSKALAAYAAFLGLSATSLERGMLIPSRGALRQAVGLTRGVLGSIQDGLMSAQRAVGSASRSMQSLNDAMSSTLDTLVGQPLRLADSMQRLMALPASELANREILLSGYMNQLRGLLASYDSMARHAAAHDPFAGRTPSRADKANLAAVQGALLQAIGSASLIAVASAKYATRADALDALNRTLATHAIVAPSAAGNGEYVSHDAAQAFDELRIATTQQVIAQTYALPRTRSYVLSQPTTILQVAAFAYGEVTAARLEELIALNRLPAHEILIMPTGKQVSYYV